MTHREAQLDAMLRHLGAAYYESLHGRPSAADVARARTAIEEAMAESPGPIARPGRGRKQGGTPPITIHPDASIPRAAAVMHNHHVKRLPVVDPGAS